MTISWYDVPGWCDFDDLYAEAVVNAPASGAVFVEVGTLFGQSAVCMASLIRASGKNIRFDTIDFHTLSDPAAPTVFADCGVLPPYQPEFEAALISRGGNFRSAFNHFLQASGEASRVIPVALRDIEAVGLYADASLDFVFLDANGTYDETKLSVSAWLTKVKPGGVLAGHDYADHYAIRQAVDECLAGRTFSVRGTSFWLEV